MAGEMNKKDFYNFTLEKAIQLSPKYKGKKKPTQAQLAEDLGVSIPTIQRIQSNKHDLYLGTIAQLAYKLGVALEDLIELNTNVPLAAELTQRDKRLPKSKVLRQRLFEQTGFQEQHLSLLQMSDFSVEPAGHSFLVPMQPEKISVELEDIHLKLEAHDFSLKAFRLAEGRTLLGRSAPQSNFPHHSMLTFRDERISRLHLDLTYCEEPSASLLCVNWGKNPAYVTLFFDELNSETQLINPGESGWLPHGAILSISECDLLILFGEPND